MSTKSIPGGTSGREPPVLEAQQETLMSVLRRAGGRPVTYAELREAGVELPASVVSELELAGIPIERCFGDAPGERHAAGVRLAEPVPEPEPEPQPASDEDLEPRPGVDSGAAGEPVGDRPQPSSRWSAVRVYRASPATALAEHAWSSALAVVTAPRSLRAPTVRLLAPVALCVAALIVGVLVVSGLGGGASHRRSASVPRARHAQQLASTTHAAGTTTQSTTAATNQTTTATNQATTATNPAPPTPVSAALATQLESQGHALLQGGQYADAVRVLRRALAATGEQAQACLQPSSNNCLTYAYALYDLGRALRLSGNSAAAVPILEARLQIDNQRSTVASELQLARQQAG